MIILIWWKSGKIIVRSEKHHSTFNTKLPWWPKLPQFTVCAICWRKHKNTCDIDSHMGDSQYLMYMLSTEDRIQSCSVAWMLTGVYQCLNVCYLLKVLHQLDIGHFALISQHFYSFLPLRSNFNLLINSSFSLKFQHFHWLVH